MSLDMSEIKKKKKEKNNLFSSADVRYEYRDRDCKTILNKKKKKPEGYNSDIAREIKKEGLNFFFLFFNDYYYYYYCYSNVKSFKCYKISFIFSSIHNSSFLFLFFFFFIPKEIYKRIAKVIVHNLNWVYRTKITLDVNESRARKNIRVIIYKFIRGKSTPESLVGNKEEGNDAQMRWW